MPTVFVHGKLRKGCSENHIIAGGICLGQAETEGQFALCIMDGKPLVTKRPASTIKGDVYTVTEEILKEIDRKQGHPHVNKREAIAVKLEDGTMQEAWIYFHVQPLRSSTLVESGDYLQAEK